MRLPTILPLRPARLAALALALIQLIPCQAQDNDPMWQAVRRRDARALRTILPSANPAVTDAAGKTPLMVAAELGSFECCRELLWAGADPLTKSRDNKTARDYLRPGVKGYVPLELLFRCYAFTRGNGVRQGKASVGHRVVINDNYVDYLNPTLRARYYANDKESKGQPNVDDDGNGFIDDVWGWNISDNCPIQVPDIVGDGSAAQRVWMELLIAKYDQIQQNLWLLLSLNPLMCELP
jgi:hypothetical protein